MTHCDKTDLPTEQCSHCLGQDAPPDKPVRLEFTTCMARYAGECAHCGERFDLGNAITKAIDEDGAEIGWCLLDHTRTTT